MNSLPLYIFALIWMVLFRKKPLIFGWKWLLCFVAGLYVSVLSTAAVSKLAAGSLPPELRSYGTAAVMLIIFMVVVIIFDIIIEKLAPGAESYRFPPVISRVLGVIFCGAAGLAAAAMIIQCAAVLPLKEMVPESGRYLENNEKWVLRIIAVVDRFSGQDGCAGKRAAVLDALKYVPPADEEAAESGEESGGVKSAAPEKQNGAVAPAAEE